jgi:ankyrin repeat protein
MRDNLLRKTAWIAAVALAVAAHAVAPRAQTSDLRVVQAARKNDTTAVRALIRQKADVTAVESDGSSALLWAAYHANSDVVRALITAGAPVNRPNRYGLTPLLQAARLGDLATIQELLKAGANVNAAQAEGETPLMAASAAGSLEAVRLLLAKGADVAAREVAADQTALMWAANEGHVDVVGALLEAGADPNAAGRVTSLPRVAPPFAAGGRMWTDYTSGGLTALMFAARQGWTDVTGRLIDGGANPNTANPDGLTALILAVINDHTDAAAMLLDKGANADDGSLYEAVTLHNVRTNETVGEATRPRPRNVNKVTPIELIGKMLDKGANPMRPATHVLHADTIGQPTVTGSNQTPLARAVQQQDVDALRLMLARGGKVNELAQGNTPLMALMAGGGRFGGGFGAAPAGYRFPGTRSVIDAAKTLLDAGADVNVTRENGETALHVAAQTGNVPMIQLLAEHGAKLDAKTMAGLTPLDYAEGKGAPPARAGGPFGGGGGFGGPRGGGPQPQAIAALRQLMGLPAEEAKR